MGYFTGRIMFETFKALIVLTYYAAAFVIVSALALAVVLIAGPVALIFWILSRYLPEETVERVREAVGFKHDDED